MNNFRKIYNSLTSLYVNIFHNNNVLNLVDLCDKYGLKIIFSSIFNKILDESYNDKYKNLKMNILDEFKSIELLSDEEFKLKIYNFIKNNNTIYEFIKYNPLIYSMFITSTSKYYIYGFLIDKQINKFNKLKENINNNLYEIEEDEEKLYNDMNEKSKNRKILLFIKHLIIEYIVSLIDILLEDYKELFKNMEYNNYLNSLNEEIYKMNNEIEEIVELYNKDINE